MQFLQFRILPIAVAATMIMAGAFFAVAPSYAAAQTAGNIMTTASGLQIIDSKVGTGPFAKTRPDLRHALHRLAL